MTDSREFRVPESPLSRAFGFTRLGAGLLLGAASEATRRGLGLARAESDDGSKAVSAFMSDANAERVAKSLSRMRGAALKVGQMLSIQDEKLMPAPLVKALERVRQSADYMPKGQLDAVLDGELGDGWRTRFESFEERPIAAASIGQVHRAQLKDGTVVAMKVQYPGVAQSIDSDLSNLKRMVTYSGLLPKTLYIEETMKFAKEELTRECDYTQEAAHQRRFRQLIGEDDPEFGVPRVIDEFSTERLLTTEFVSGLPLDRFAAAPAHVRNRIGELFLKLTLRELFQFRFMQTDPNFSNFLYDQNKDQMQLIDFGAASEYSRDFVDNYIEMVYACGEGNPDDIVVYGQKLGFLTGEEGKTMIDAHIAASKVVGEPFGTSEPYDFRASNITGRMAVLGKKLVEHRLCPPPKEAYSLHRRLSGAFLMCVRLGAVFPCRDMFIDIYRNRSDQEQPSWAAHA